MSTAILESSPDTLSKRTVEVYRAAAELIVEKGFGAASINDIAQAVGMTKAGLYHHISGKQDMLYQIMKYAMDSLENVVVVPAQLVVDPEQRLREIIRLHIHGANEHGLAFTILMSEVNHLNSAQRKEIVDRKKAYHAVARNALQELAQEGRLRELDINIATMHFMLSLTGIARWDYGDFSSNEEHLIEQTMAYIMAGILKPVASATRKRQ